MRASPSPTLRTLVVSPTYNERANLERHVREIRAAAPEVDVLVVDDASPDGTGDVADALAAADSHVRVMHRAGKLGLGTAYIQAFTRALAEGYDRVVSMDADLSHDARHLPQLLQALDEGADFVIGSRNIPHGRVEGWGPGRHVISKGGSLYARTVLGLDVHDLTSGYKAFTRRALEAIELSRVHSTGYAFMIETTYRALSSGMRVVEVPIVFVDRVLGKSKMSRKVFLEAAGVVWRLRFDSARGTL